MLNLKGNNKKGSSQAKLKENINSSYKPIKRNLTDNIYYLGSVKQASDYESITEYLINQIKKTFPYGMDIGTVLETLEVLDLNKLKPSLEVSLSSDEVIRIAKDKQFEIEFKAEYDAFTKRKQALEMNFSKAYSFIWDQCAKSLQNKLEARTDYSTIKGNPINLLKAIKQQVTDNQESCYEMSTILEAFKNLVNIRQKDTESLQDYTKRFKTVSEVMESHVGGPLELRKFMSKMKEFNINDEESIEKCKAKAYELFLAYMYMEGADKSKYGSLLTGLQTQFSLGNNQYPKTVCDVNSVLSNHRFDNSSKNKQTGTKNETINENKIDENPELSSAQLNGKCYCCGKAGHKSPNCKWNNKPRHEWAINKARKQQSNQNNGTNNEINRQMSNVNADSTPISQSTSATSGAVSGWSGVNMQFFQGMDMRNIILLDNQSTVSLFCNRDYVENVWSVEKPLELATNAGILKTNQKAFVKGFGEVWFDSRAITNIFSFAEMEDKHQITYNSTNESAFLVELQDKIVKFKRSDNGLYYFDPPYNKSKQMCATNVPMDSVQENMKLFTNRQVERAKLTREIYHALGSPSLQDFKTIVTTNSVKNLPITLEDIKTAEMIFGTDVGVLKGKTVTTILCDNEFQPIMKDMEKIYGVIMNYANPQEHVPEIERSIPVIKERFRVAFHRLPFKRIPKIMIKILAMECTKKLNFFPPKNGISNYYSPRTIMHQEPLDYNKHCAVPFGTYVQAHNEPNFKNSQHPRTIDCIYLRYVDNLQGGHHLLDLRTGQTIKRRTITQVPITQNIIEMVHKLAEADKMSEGFKITNRNNIALFDSSWIAGVDYEEENDDETSEEDMETSVDNMDPNEIAKVRSLFRGR